MTAYALRALAYDMRTNNVEMERFSFTFNKKVFDCILVVKPNSYEILVGVRNENWACILYMDMHLQVAMSDHDFFALCDLLNLKPGAHHFTSFDFLLLLSKSAPKKPSGVKVMPGQLRAFSKVADVEEGDKIYFVSWMTHIRDGRTARNIKKTEFFFGTKVAEFCKRNNISSVWSANPTDEKYAALPPGFIT